MPEIKVLPPEEARRIAAGEVIDRPAALIREFLDNAIDASALNIDVSIDEGGCKKAEVSDNGSGMSRDDLELCCLTHATSKIRGLDDLDTALSLGFRGEALAAAQAVSRLEIITSTDGRNAFRLETGPGENYPIVIEPTRRTIGTTVRAVNLFETIPARKRFLKREGSEALICRQAFIDKALAFNEINFKFIQDGKLKDFLPAHSTKKERFAAALLQSGQEFFLHEVNVTGEGFSAVIVIGGPDLNRNDRRQLFIFANGRKVQDYSLIQAVEYGSQGWFPNGVHPVGAVYIEIDPSLADFNIHPAKREVRFRNPGAVHQAVSGAVKNFFHNLFLGASRRTGADANNEVPPHKRTGAENSAIFKFSHGGAENTEYTANNEYMERREKFNYANDITGTYNIAEKLEYAANSSVFSGTVSARSGGNSSEEPVYAGRVFNLFILIEWGEKLYIIDQHAAHERILFDKFLKEAIPKQQLLAPIPFCTESGEEDSFLEAKREELSGLGVDIEKDTDGNWRIEALPADWRLGDAATIKEILDLRTAGENMARRWAATLCCHAAIKDGDYPDDETAFALGREALSLPDPHCPHGRPIWTEISREALYKAVRRN